MSNERFLIDSNCLMTPFLQYYTFERARAFWEFMRREIEGGRIIILDMVYEEVFRGRDDLSTWIQDFKDLRMFRSDPEIASNYRVIINYIRNSELYQDKAVVNWANLADGWLIAAAMTYGHTVVTFEISAKPSAGSPSKNPKIPDICNYFHVKCRDLFYLLDDMEFRF